MKILKFLGFQPNLNLSFYTYFWSQLTNYFQRGKDILDVDGMDGLDGLNDRLGGGLERRNRNKRNKEIEKPKKRIRKLSTLSLR